MANKKQAPWYFCCCCCCFVSYFAFYGFLICFWFVFLSHNASSEIFFFLIDLLLIHYGFWFCFYRISVCANVCFLCFFFVSSLSYLFSPIGLLVLFCLFYFTLILLLVLMPVCFLMRERKKECRFVGWEEIGEEKSQSEYMVLKNIFSPFLKKQKVRNVTQYLQGIQSLGFIPFTA